ncbi:hypothetical protein Pmani_030592 [Petrolisthes manimaculis]|uniref:long-chain-fatty-acid--CoA ligase n=1 Tax=Petrolisthes manimaculis TaxID=1843537 RepID=A0AAE1NWU7_9EUCA|nr:hypothetical protein Pmani_030592 [Petrolisthes manimaculis]
MATRRVHGKRQVEERGHTINKLELGEYTWMTYIEVAEMVRKVGLGIRHHGVKPLDRVVILAETRAEWLIAALGCLQQRVTVVTLYSTLSDEGIIHGINETEVSFILTSYNMLPRLTTGLLLRCPKVKTVVVMEDQLEGVGLHNDLPRGMTMVPFQDLIKPNSKDASVDFPKVKAEDVAILMYTSGSTGIPKGVELTHTNILSCIVDYSAEIDIGPKDRYLAFLPLAHVMELGTEMSLLALGAAILYSSPYTLTKGSPNVMEGSKGDASVAKPTVMNAVPLVLDRILKTIL